MASSRLFMPILCLLAALGIFSTSLYLPSLPAIGKALSASQESVQLTLTVFFLGSSIGSLLLGPLSDHMGRLVVAKGGLVLFVIASFWCAQADTILSLLMGRFLQGVAASAGPLVARAVGRDLYEGAHFTKFSATLMMVISISPAIAPTLGGLIEFYFGWEKNFYFLMVFGLILVILVWIWLPETNDRPPTSLHPYAVFNNYRILFKTPAYAWLCLGVGLQCSALFCYVTMSPYLFISLFGWSAQTYGYVGIATAFGNMAGFAFGRHMAHRIGATQGILIGSFSSVFLSFAFIGSAFILPITSTLLIVYVFCFFCMQALSVVNMSAAAMNFFPHMAGTSAAMVGAVQIGAGVFGSLLASLLPVSPFALGVTLGGLSLFTFMIGLFLEKKKWLGR